MHSLILYGTPEDGIKIEGEIQEEVDAFALEEGAYLAISDGTLLSATIDGSGVWRISAVSLGSETEVQRSEGTLNSETESDRVTLTNPTASFKWVLMGSSLISPLDESATGTP